jgi:tRNA dimethylallyltransferase
MLDLGFEQEVRALWARGGLTPDMPSMRSVGYRQMLKYLLGDYTYGEMVQRGIIAARQLSKRQMTWLRAEHCVWLPASEASLAQALDLIEAACR